MAESSIEWTEMTWNPSTGCTKISIGCANCYAEKMAIRLQHIKVEKYMKGFDVACHYEELNTPYNWKKPRMIFVNSMSDLFHEDIPLSFIQNVFRVMNECSRHTFQVLTKRAEVLERYSAFLNWTPNIWMGVTVEHSNVTHRINKLRKIPAAIRFLSIEPMLSAMPSLDLLGINWVIVGGESGYNARPIRESWVIDIQRQCENKSIPFFFKQWGGRNKKATGNQIDGEVFHQLPVCNGAQVI
jgi:protein gp37